MSSSNRGSKDVEGKSINGTPTGSARKSISVAVEAVKQLEEERKKVRTAESWKRNQEEALEGLKKEIKNLQDNWERDKKINADMRNEIIEVQQKIEEALRELAGLRGETYTEPSSPHHSGSENNTPKTARKSIDGKDEDGSDDSDGPPATPNSPSMGEQAKYRSWNKKLIGNYQDLVLQLNHEKEAVKQLTQFKADNEPKLETMKKAVRDAADSRLKLEEDMLRMEKEMKGK
jgi:hypothetical protein